MLITRDENTVLNRHRNTHLCGEVPETTPVFELNSECRPLLSDHIRKFLGGRMGGRTKNCLQVIIGINPFDSRWGYYCKLAFWDNSRPIVLKAMHVTAVPNAPFENSIPAGNNTLKRRCFCS